MSEYAEDTWDEFGVRHQWRNATCLDKCVTSRNTVVEMVHRPNWGIACYMDNAIQSCEVDEKIYHESLVHPIMASGPVASVMIIGGGEGATAREVLKWPVNKLDMYEWDKDVVDLFKAKYPQWAKGAWKDRRLTVHYDDIFKTIKAAPKKLYEVIIIDLFDPEESNLPQWDILLKNIRKWLQPQGRLVMYSGIRNILRPRQPHQVLTEMVCIQMPFMKITPYKVFIPSFSGESTFLLVTNPMADQEFTVPSHLTPEIWESYKVFNW
jgi:spermidine synthase